MTKNPMGRTGWCEFEADNTLNGLTSHEYCGTLGLTCSCSCHGEE